MLILCWFINWSSLWVPYVYEETGCVWSYALSSYWESLIWDYSILKKMLQGWESGNGWSLLWEHRNIQNLWAMHNRKLLIHWNKSRDTDTLTFLTILDDWLVNQQADVTALKEGLSVRQGFRRGDPPHSSFLNQPDGKRPALLVSSQRFHAEWQTDALAFHCLMLSDLLRQK